MIGNIAAAVDCCLEAGLMAEALLLAQVRCRVGRCVGGGVGCVLGVVGVSVGEGTGV